MMNEKMKELLKEHNIDTEKSIIHISRERMKDFCTDISGKWVPVEDVLKLVDRINELEKQLYGSR